MGPKALRSASKKASSELPETARVNFLTSAAHLVSSSLPQLSTHLGQQALKLADAKQVLLSSVTARNQLCRTCGGPLNVETCDEVYISWLSEGSSRRLSKRLGGPATRHARASGNSSNRQGKPMNRVVAVRKCSVCQHASVRPFLSVQLAQHQLSKEGFAHVRVHGRDHQQQAAARKQHRQQVQKDHHHQQQHQDSQEQPMHASCVDHLERAQSQMHTHQQQQLQAVTGQHLVTVVAAGGGAEVCPAASCPAARVTEAAAAEPLAVASEAIQGQSVAAADRPGCDDVSGDVAGDASCVLRPGSIAPHPQHIGPSELSEQQQQVQQQQVQQQHAQVTTTSAIQEQTALAPPRSTAELHLELPAAHTPSHALPSRNSSDGAVDDRAGVAEAGLVLQLPVCVEACGASSQVCGCTADWTPVTEGTEDPHTTAEARTETGLLPAQPHCPTTVLRCSVPHVPDEQLKAQQHLQHLVTVVATDAGIAAGAETEVAHTVSSAAGASDAATAAQVCTVWATSAAAPAVEHFSPPQLSAIAAAPQDDIVANNPSAPPLTTAAAVDDIVANNPSAPPLTTVSAASCTIPEAATAAAAAAAPSHVGSSMTPAADAKGSSQAAMAVGSLQGAAHVKPARLWPLCPAAFAGGSWPQHPQPRPSQQQQPVQVVVDELQGDVEEEGGQEVEHVSAASLACLSDSNPRSGAASSGSAVAERGPEALRAAAAAVDTAVQYVEDMSAMPSAAAAPCSGTIREAAAPAAEEQQQQWKAAECTGVPPAVCNTLDTWQGGQQAGDQVLSRPADAADPVQQPAGEAASSPGAGACSAAVKLSQAQRQPLDGGAEQQETPLPDAVNCQEVRASAAAGSLDSSREARAETCSAAVAPGHPPLQVPGTLWRSPLEVPETSAATPAAAADITLSAAAPADSPDLSSQPLHPPQAPPATAADVSGGADVSSPHALPAGAADSQSLSYHGPWAPHRRPAHAADADADAAPGDGTDSQLWSCSVSQGSDGQSDVGDGSLDGQDLEQEVEAKEQNKATDAWKREGAARDERLECHWGDGVWGRRLHRSCPVDEDSGEVNTDDSASDRQGQQLRETDAELQRDSGGVQRKRRRGVECAHASAPPSKTSWRAAAAAAAADTDARNAEPQPRSQGRGGLSCGDRTTGSVGHMPNLPGQPSTARHIGKPQLCRGQQGRAFQLLAVHKHLMRKNVGRKVLRHWVYRT